MNQRKSSALPTLLGSFAIATAFLAPTTPARAQVAIGGIGWGGFGWGGMGWGGYGLGGWGMGPWGWGVAPAFNAGWGFGAPVMMGVPTIPVVGGWNYGWGLPGMWPYFGGYGNPYLDGGWTLASGVSPLAVESVAIERAFARAEALATPNPDPARSGRQLAPGRYKITITIEPLDAPRPAPVDTAQPKQ